MKRLRSAMIALAVIVPVLQAAPAWSASFLFTGGAYNFRGFFVGTDANGDGVIDLSELASFQAAAGPGANGHPRVDYTLINLASFSYDLDGLIGNENTGSGFLDGLRAEDGVSHESVGADLAGGTPDESQFVYDDGLMFFKGFGGPVTVTSSVPEPGTWALLMLGIGAIGAVLRRWPRSRMPVPA